MTDEKELSCEGAYAHFGKWLSAQAFWLQDAAWHIYNGNRWQQNTSIR